MPTEPKKFRVSYRNKFLSKTDQFNLPMGMHPDAQDFDTEEAAVNKAQTLGVNLDKIRVVQFRVIE